MNLHARVVSPPEKSLRYPLDRKLGGVQSQSGQGRENKDGGSC
jgi:hypothetical protein